MPPGRARRSQGSPWTDTHSACACFYFLLRESRSSVWKGNRARCGPAARRPTSFRSSLGVERMITRNGGAGKGALISDFSLQPSTFSHQPSAVSCQLLAPSHQPTGSPMGLSLRGGRRWAACPEEPEGGESPAQSREAAPSPDASL